MLISLLHFLISSINCFYLSLAHFPLDIGLSIINLYEILLLVLLVYAEMFIFMRSLFPPLV